MAPGLTFTFSLCVNLRNTTSAADKHISPCSNPHPQPFPALLLKPCVGVSTPSAFELHSRPFASPCETHVGVYPSRPNYFMSSIKSFKKWEQRLLNSLCAPSHKSGPMVPCIYSPNITWHLPASWEVALAVYEHADSLWEPRKHLFLSGWTN